MGAQAVTPRALTIQVAEDFAAAHPEDVRSRLLRAAAPDRRDPIVDAIVMDLYGVAGPTLHCGPSSTVAMRLVLGEHPHDIAPALTRREACAWALQSDHETPIAWLWARTVAEWPVDLAEASCPRTIGVVRWVLAVCSDGDRRAALLRSRHGEIGGQAVEGRVVDRLDELTDADLRPSVMETIDVATARLCRERWTGPDELIPPAMWHADLPAGVRVLRSFSDLLTEGSEMRHCAAVYAQRVMDRACVIVSVTGADGRRSTAEIVGGSVAQHRGARNESPPASCVDRLAEVLRWS